MLVKKLRDTATLPTQGSAGAAGWDLYFDSDEKSYAKRRMTFIEPHQTKMLGTGIAVAIPEGYFGAVFARSGIAASKGLRPANCVGVIDNDYRGEIKVAIHNDSDTTQHIDNGDRIAQLVIIPYAYDMGIIEVDDIGDTERGDGGFGSTGR